jgi:hypothetical protein
MASDQDRVVSVWGARAYAWSSEERPRAAGFQVDLSGHRRVLGFPADPFPPARRRWLRRRARHEPELEPDQRRWLDRAIAEILPGPAGGD